MPQGRIAFEFLFEEDLDEVLTQLESMSWDDDDFIDAEEVANFKLNDDDYDC